MDIQQIDDLIMTYVSNILCRIHKKKQISYVCIEL